jgi:hypothetical protein
MIVRLGVPKISGHLMTAAKRLRAPLREPVQVGLFG